MPVATALRMKVSSPRYGCIVELDAVDRVAKSGVMGIVPAAQPCPALVVA